MSLLLHLKPDSRRPGIIEISRGFQLCPEIIVVAITDGVIVIMFGHEIEQVMETFGSGSRLYSLQSGGANQICRGVKHHVMAKRAGGVKIERSVVCLFSHC